MNPQTLTDFAATIPDELNFVDGPTINKNLLVGWLIGHGANLPFSATAGQVFGAIKRLAERAKQAEAVGSAALANSTANPNMNTPGLDVSQLTRSEASELFAMHVEEIQKATGCDYNTAVNRAKILHKPLVARMNDASAPLTAPRQPSPAESTALANAISPAPVFAPQIKMLLGLPADATDQECNVAWTATKGILTPRASQAIWRLLSALMRGQMGAERGGGSVSDASVELKMKERYPQLANEVL